MLKIGWSKRNISIEGPIGIPGQFYERISKGILDPNMLCALIIDDGNDMTVLVSADMVSLNDGIINDVRASVLADCPTFPVDKIIMNATHTHTSPRYQRMGSCSYDLAPKIGVDMIDPMVYRTFFIKQATDAILEAYNTRDVGSYAYGSDFAVVAHHRRPIYRDDLRLRPESANTSPALFVNKHAKMYGATNDPMFLEYEGNVDSSAYFFFTFDKDEKLTGAIVNVPCPSQNSEAEDMLSASYWAELRALVKEKYGDIYILPQCAAAGDMAPRALHDFYAQDRRWRLKYGEDGFDGIKNKWEIWMRRDIAERIMRAFESVYSWAQKEKIYDAKVEHRAERLDLDAWKITKEQYEAAKAQHAKDIETPWQSTDDKYADYKANTRLSSIFKRFESIINRYEKDFDTRCAEVHIARVGDVAFASNPFELYVAYQHRIQARSPFTQTFIVQLAASIDAAGYLCTERAANNMGYSANIYSCPVAPSGGDKLVEETLRVLNDIHEN